MMRDNLKITFVAGYNNMIENKLKKTDTDKNEWFGDYNSNNRL